MGNLQDKLNQAANGEEVNISSSDVSSSSFGQEEAEELVEEVVQPQLTEENLQSLHAARALMDHTSITERMEEDRLNYVVKAVKRDQQIEANLDALDLTDLIFNNTVTQTVPITDSFVLTFQTVPARTALLYRSAVDDYLRRWGDDAGEDNGNDREFLMSLASLCCGLNQLNGETTMASTIISEKNSTLAVELLSKAMRDMADKPLEIIDSIAAQHRNFVARVRKVLDHAGYRSQELKKS